MSEFRQDITTKEWVIISTERAKRPDEFKKKDKKEKKLPERDDKCPFCPGNEEKTPPAVYTIEKDGKWKLRIVPNKFAALQPDITPDRNRIGRFLKAEGFGISEVVIETPEHNKTIATMSYEQARDVVIAYKERYLQISENKDISLINIFRNYGEKAGTSLEHPHSQIIASPIVPPHIRDQITQAILSTDSYGSCIFCDMIKEELNQKIRIILESKHFIVLTPFASRYPFEIRIFPKKHNCNFGCITDEDIEDFAYVLRLALKKLYTALDDPDYNYMIRSCPTDYENVKHFHWHLEILPKLTTPAGFELGTGIFINVTTPENCAEILRNIEVE
ncbi:MAG: galactose-1-phosphate uridylyltransferase [Acidobacteriota bacterium]